MKLIGFMIALIPVALWAGFSKAFGLGFCLAELVFLLFGAIVCVVGERLK